MAAIGAAIFASMDPKTTLAGAGETTGAVNGTRPPAETSNWKRVARAEAMREL
jgi:hypothetical protein